uniref:Uncharacterized protein n=1 Tax=Anguilla anguilla TaxID=7936 RepID=A0A0E9PGR7_ANGAN
MHQLKQKQHCHRGHKGRVGEGGRQRERERVSVCLRVCVCVSE